MAGVLQARGVAAPLSARAIGAQQSPVRYK